MVVRRTASIRNLLPMTLQRSLAMSPSPRIPDVPGALAGIAFAALLFLGVATVDPQRGVSDQQLQHWWAESDNRAGYLLSMYLMLAACPLFLLFVVRLGRRLRSVEENGWADVMVGSGIVVTTALGICAVTRGVIATSMHFADEPLPGVDTLRFQTNLAYVTWDLVMLFMAVLIAATSIIALTVVGLPRWLGWFGVPVAAACVILLALHMAPFAIPLVILWVVAHSWQLWRSSAVAPVGEPVRPMEATGAQT